MNHTIKSAIKDLDIISDGYFRIKNNDSYENDCLRSQCERRCNCKTNRKQTFTEYLSKLIKNPNEFINILSTCECCERHQINRPIKLDGSYNNSSNIKHINNNCECQCRHYSRFICRAFETNNSNKKQ